MENTPSTSFNLDNEVDQFLSDSILSDTETFKDDLEELTEAMLAAAQPKWQPKHLNQILFCTVQEMKKLKKQGAVFVRDNFIKEPNETNYQHPVVYVSFVGIIEATKYIKGEKYFDISDETGSIICKYNGDIEENCNEYYNLHKNFRQSESTTTDWFDKSTSKAMWLLARRKKEISKVHTNGLNSSKGQQVMVIGKLCGKYQSRSVYINKIVTVEKEQHKWIKKMIEVGHFYDDWFRKKFSA